MINYNPWLSNDAHSRTLQAQHNENMAASYFEALKPLRVALDTTLSPLRHAAQFWRRRQLHNKAVRELSALDDHMLKDIGISRSQIGNVALMASLEPQSAGLARSSIRPAAAKPAQQRPAETECQIIPLAQPDRTHEIQHHPNSRRHRYPLPLNAA